MAERCIVCDGDGTEGGCEFCPRPLAPGDRLSRDGETVTVLVVWPEQVLVLLEDGDRIDLWAR
jgi:hypothetical protein